MKRIIPLIIALLIMSACTPKEYKTNIVAGEKSFLQSNYEAALQSFEVAKGAKKTDEINDWITYTKEMLEREVALKEFDIEKLEALQEATLDFPDDWEGKEAATDQLAEWNVEVEDLFTEIATLDDYFTELDKTLKEEDFKQVEKQLTEIEIIVNAAKKQVYFDTYTNKLKDKTKQVTEQKTAYEKEQKRIAAEKKKAEEKKIAEAAAEEKRKQEEAKKQNMYNWSDAEITSFMQNKFSDIANENLLISIFDRNESPFQIEVRFDKNPEGLGEDEPYLTFLQGLFEVHDDGRLYEIDVLEGNIPVDY